MLNHNQIYKATITANSIFLFNATFSSEWLSKQSLRQLWS